jgi:hypothetical protein
LEIATRIADTPAALGLVTPVQAFGADFVLGLPGCSRVDNPAARADSHSQDDAHSQELPALRQALAEGWLFSDCPNRTSGIGVDLFAPGAGRQQDGNSLSGTSR